MPDEPIRSAEFSAAMKAMKDSVDALSQRVAAVEALNQTMLLSRINEAREEGRQEGARDQQIADLGKRMDKFGNLTAGLSIAVGAQLLWTMLAKAFAK